ncbi:MAG: LPS assembly protein LptD [Pseudomonadales bacterium]
MLPEYCAGSYLDPEFPLPLDDDPNQHPIVVRADRAEYLVDGLAQLSGNVSVQQGNRSGHAASGTLDPRSRDSTLSGGVQLLEPGIALQGSTGRVNLDTRAADLDDVEFLLLDGDMRGRADRLGQDAGGNLSMESVSFTRCEPGSNSWRITADSVRVADGENFGTARNAVVRMKGVPVLYTPYIRFPVNDERQSGLLFPDLGYSASEGADITLPYYLNLAPNYDATLAPRYISERGAGLEGEFRHLSRWERTTVTGAFLGEDDLYNGVLSRDDFDALLAQGEIAGEFNPASRWLYGVQHEGKAGRVRTIIDYTAVSDRDYFRDLGSFQGGSNQIQLERRGEVQYAVGGLFMRLWAQRFDRLDEGTIDPYQRLPELELTYDGQLLGPLQWSLGSKWSSFDRNNDLLTGLNRTVGERIHVEPRLRLPLSWPWGFLTLAGGYRYTAYDLRDVPASDDDTPERGIGMGTAHAGLFFERELSAFGSNLIQTLEPQVYYLYQEYENQDRLPRFDASDLTFGYSQLFRDNRFSGIDRIGDADQVSVGVTSRFLDAGSGREYLSASIGQIFYFQDRDVTLSGAPGVDERQSSSALASELAANIGAGWRLTGTLIWDPNDNQVDEGAGALQYRRDNRHILNLGYRNRAEQEIEQTDFSLYWPLTRNFSVLGRWNYDVTSGRTVEGFAGIEYNDCCWQVRLLARRYINSPSAAQIDTTESDEGVFLQIVFKGLSGIGDKVESVLTEGIKGYRTEDYDGF